jgi:hypothetical protein
MRAVNLIPGDQRGDVSAAGRSGGGAYAVLGVVGGLAVLAGLYGVASHEISDNKTKAANLSAKAAKAEVAAAQLAPYTSFIAVREARIQAVSLLMGTRFDWAHSMHELGRVLPKDASISSIDASVGGSSAGASASKSGASAPKAASGVSTPASSSASSSVASATPAGAVPTFTINGCATSQGEVALVLQRLRLMDGVSEVKLTSSTKSSSGSSSSGTAGACAQNDPAFIVTVAFQPLPSPPAAGAPSTTLAADTHGAGSAGATTGGTR